MRQRLIGMRTALINQIRGFLLENGIALPRGRGALERALAGLPETAAQAIGPGLGELIELLRSTWRTLDEKIGALDDEVLALARGDAASRRLMTIPAIGPLTATALVAAIGPVAEGRTMHAFVSFGRSEKRRVEPEDTVERARGSA